MKNFVHTFLVLLFSVSSVSIVNIVLSVISLLAGCHQRIHGLITKTASINIIHFNNSIVIEVSCNEMIKINTLMASHKCMEKSNK